MPVMSKLLAPQNGGTPKPYAPPGQQDWDGYHQPPSDDQSDDCGGAGYSCPTFTHPPRPSHSHTGRPTATKSAAVPGHTYTPTKGATASPSVSVSSSSTSPSLPVTGADIGPLAGSGITLVAIGALLFFLARQGRRRRA